MRLQDEVRAVVRREGVIARKHHPELASAIAWLVRRGELTSVLPGVYAASASCDSFVARVTAAAVWDPDAVLTDAAAARLTFWPTLSVPAVRCSTRRDPTSRPGFAFSRRAVPAELVLRRGGLQVTSPALTALDLCERHGGDGIDQALRMRATTLELLHEALDLTGGRDGNVLRRRMLLDSRDQPWSAAERLCHRLLRSARITGWQGNLPVVVRGQAYFLDVGFPALRLVVEIDGRLHEDDPEVFESDRGRQNALVLDGWTVLRFTWRMLTEHPDRFVAAVREAVASLSRAR